MIANICLSFGSVYTFIQSVSLSFVYFLLPFHLAKKNEDGTLKYYAPGVYGGADCAVDGVVKSGHISGKGVLYVRSTLKPSTLLIIK